MDRRTIRKLRNAAIAVLFAAAIIYCIVYWNKSLPNNEPVENPVAIEGEVSDKEPEEGAEDVREEAMTPENGSEADMEDAPESFCDIMAVVTAGEITQFVKLYIRDDLGCFFLPSYAKSAQITWQFDENKYRVLWDGQAVHNNDRLIWPGQGEAGLVIGQMESGHEAAYRFQVMFSENLPALSIDTQTDRITGQGKEEASGEEYGKAGTFLCVSQAGTVDSEGEFDGISVRDYAGYDAVKKNYDLVFEKEEELLGMGSATRWMLQANAYDLSRMRNKIIYDIAEKTGAVYGIDSAYADVWINGEYAGNYLVCRTYGEGTVIQVQSTQEGYEVQEPDRGARAGQKELAFHVLDLLERLKNCGSKEEYGQLCEAIDQASFARMYLLNMLANEPALSGTETLYLAGSGEDGKLYAGMAMDYDRSLGNAQGAHFEQMICFAPGLLGRLSQWDAFEQEVQAQFVLSFGTAVEGYLSGGIDRIREQIQASVLMDDLRWGLPEYNHYMDFNQSYATFQDAARYVSYYLNARYELLGQYLDEPKQWHLVEYTDSSSQTGSDGMGYLVRDGEKIPSEATACIEEIFGCDGWKYEDGRGCETGRPVYENMRLISYTEEEPEQEESASPDQEEGQEENHAGYSKRFVVLCMLFAAGFAGVCGIILGWILSRVLRERK